MIAETRRSQTPHLRRVTTGIQLFVAPNEVSIADGQRSAPGPLCDAFLASAALHQHRPCLVTSETAWSYSAIRAAAVEVSNRLSALPNFRPGDRVLLLCENSPEYLAGFYGVLLAGGVVVPLPSDTEADRLQAVLKSTNPVAIFTRGKGRTRSSAILRNLRMDSWTLTGSVGRQWPVHAVRGGDELAAIYFTSGSTGEPKGVMLSENNLLYNARTVADYLELSADERALAVLPFCHAFGNSVLQSHLLTGGALILAGSPAFPGSLLESLVGHRATSFSGVPELFHMLVRQTSFLTTQLPQLRYMSVAGGALSTERVREIQAAITPARFFVMYGQTEATARLSYLPPGCLPDKAGSIGRGIPGTSLEVVDSSGMPVLPGVVGRLRARGPGIMLGYWNDDAGTRQVLRDGWLYTGDLAVRDAEGFIYPRGRENCLMKVFGHRVHPTEIEQLVEEEFEVSRAIAVPFEDAEYRIRIALFIQPLAERSGGEFVQQVLAHCRRNLPSYKVPAYIELVDQTPMNAALKLDRNRLACWARQRFTRQSPSTA